LSAFSIQFSLFLFVFLAWLSLSIYVILNRLRHERRNDSLDKVLLQLGKSQPVMLTAKTRSELVYPVITRLPQPVIYRVATDVAVYTPVAEVFVEHALARWGLANVFAIASEVRPGIDRWQRISALCILTRAKADCIHDLLFDALQDEDADVASNAAVFLGRLQDSRAAELLVRALRLHLYLPSFIARQLDNFKIPIDGLLEPLLDLDDAHVRYWAVILLARHGGRGELHAQKIARLAEDPDPAIRKAVVQALGMLDASREALIVLGLLYDDIAFVRVHAVKALARFNRPDFTGSLAAMLGDPEWRVRLAAKEALSSMEQTVSLGASARSHAAGDSVGTDFGGMDNLHAYAADNGSEKTRVHPGSKERRL
jgi:HEAT repeat protein